MSSSDMLNNLGPMLLSGQIEVVDCTGILGPNTPLIQLPPPFKNTPQVEIHKISEYDDDGPVCAWNWLKLGEHSGTHFDAPKHWFTGKDLPDNATDTLDIQKVVAPVNCIDCSKESAEDPDFLLTVDHIKAWETEHGAIQEGEWVVMRTDWDSRAGDAGEFLNFYDDAPHSPGPTAEAVQYLIDKGITGWGTQCIGTDAGCAGGMEPMFPAHNLLHKNNRFGLASLANLDKLPAKGAILIAAPLKIEGGTGSPIRALALVQK